MARIRTVKPEYWGSPKTASVSIPARLLFLGLLTEADDEGRLLASTTKLMGAIFPNDKSVTARRVTTWLDELEVAGFIQLYTVDGIEYAWVVGFTEHQKVQHPSPSRLPPPSDHPTELFVNHSRNGQSKFSGEGKGTGNREQGGAAKATRVPDPFVVTPSMEEWARLNVPRVDWEHETKKFWNHWTAASGSNAVKRDWTAAWRNWLLKASEWQKAGPVR